MFAQAFLRVRCIQHVKEHRQSMFDDAKVSSICERKMV